MNVERSRLAERAAVHAALGDPGRLAIVDALLRGEASPTELQRPLVMPSNLLAHHVRVLEKEGVVSPASLGSRPSPDLPGADPRRARRVAPDEVQDAVRVVFVCTHNSARSQLAAALWNDASPVPATSAGTHPATAVHPGAVAAAQRHRVPLAATPPRYVDVVGPDDTVITVCDAAHEELAALDGPRVEMAAGRLHWSIPDPARTGDDVAFDRVVTDLTDRIARVAPAVRATGCRSDTGGPHAR